MLPPRIFGIALLVLGIVLLLMGIRETESLGSQVNEFFTGSFSDRAIWLLIGGVVAICAGAAAARLPARKGNR